jgi:hypothetical protein
VNGGIQAAGSGGGGGGSGAGPAGSTGVNGVRTGNGQLTITFEADPVGCPSPAVAVPVEAAPRFTG